MPQNSLRAHQASTNRLHRNTHHPSHFELYYSFNTSATEASCILKGFFGDKSLQHYFLLLYLLKIVFATFWAVKWRNVEWYELYLFRKMDPNGGIAANLMQWESHEHAVLMCMVNRWPRPSHGFCPEPSFTLRLWFLFWWFVSAGSMRAEVTEPQRRRRMERERQ